MASDVASPMAEVRARVGIGTGGSGGAVRIVSSWAESRRQESLGGSRPPASHFVVFVAQMSSRRLGRWRRVFWGQFDVAAALK